MACSDVHEFRSSMNPSERGKEILYRAHTSRNGAGYVAEESCERFM